MASDKLQCLVGSWGHSREEDGDGLTVYRREGYAFPPSRGRDWIEFRSDGVVIDHGPAPDDRSRATPGTWSADGDDAFRVELRGASRAATIVACDDSILRLKWESR